MITQKKKLVCNECEQASNFYEDDDANILINTSTGKIEEIVKVKEEDYFRAPLYRKK